MIENFGKTVYTKNNYVFIFSNTSKRHTPIARIINNKLLFISSANYCSSTSCNISAIKFKAEKLGLIVMINFYPLMTCLNDSTYMDAVLNIAGEGATSLAVRQSSELSRKTYKTDINGMTVYFLERDLLGA